MIRKAQAQQFSLDFRLDIGKRVQTLLIGNANSGVIGGAYSYLNDGISPGSPLIAAVVAALSNAGWTASDDGVSTISIS